MKLLIPLCLLLGTAGAAPPQAEPGQAEKQEIFRLLEAVRLAVRGDDWNEAWRQGVALNNRLATYSRSHVSPSLELNHLEMMAGKDAISRGQFLARLAHTAYAASRLDKAESYANEALEASRHGVFPWTGDAIHQGHIVLGRLALMRNDVESAKRNLLLAGKTPGSSSLDALGPNMGLARDLLNRGETQTVLDYLEECGSFWTGNRGKLAEWIVLVRGGLKPDFGANLNY